MKKKTFTRKEVRNLLKLQLKRVRSSVGRLDYRADDEMILKRISKCSLINF